MEYYVASNMSGTFSFIYSQGSLKMMKIEPVDMQFANWLTICPLTNSDAAAQIHHVLRSPTPDGCGEIAWHQFAAHTLNRV